MLVVAVAFRSMGFLRDLYGTPIPLYLAAFAAVALVQLRAARVDLRAWHKQLRQRFSEAVRDPVSARSKSQAKASAGEQEASARPQGTKTTPQRTESD